MSRPAVADFVDSFFTRLLFQPDDSIATASLDELSPNAEININGSPLTAAEFTTLISTQFRPAFSASIISIQDLNVVPSNDTGTAGTVAQYTKYKTIGSGGEELLQSATTIVRVGARDGRGVVEALWEAQTVDKS